MKNSSWIKWHALLALVLTNLTLFTAFGATIIVTSTADSGPGSLRQAILDANADASPDEVAIEFSIPGSGVQTIAPLTPLPAILRAVTIDGYTQPGASPNTLADADNAVLLVELSGANLSGALADRGLLINASDCTVRGLVINRFTFHDTAGIWVEGEYDNTVIEGNFIGTDVTGMTAQPNFNAIAIQARSGRVGGLTPASRNIVSGNSYGIFLSGPNHEVVGNYVGVGSDGVTAVPNTAVGIYLHYCYQTQVGGPSPGARNVISGNHGGCTINQGGSNVVQGNFIGTDTSGTLRRGNVTGLMVNESTRNLIGGTDAGAGNLVSGNLGEGVRLEGLGSSNNVVVGNLIGPDVTGTSALGNGDYGLLCSATGNLIGGTNGSARNVITDTGTGVAVFGSTATNNAVLGNSIFGNGIGIDLGSFSPADLGPTPNDPGDTDEGANHYQNSPEILLVERAGRNLKVAYRVDSATANSAYPLTVEFFIADAAGQGRTFIHRTTYANANALDQITFKPAALPASGEQVVATATDSNGNTSEFSVPTAVTPQGHKVLVCHEGKTISIDQHAVSTHLMHGDSLGACP